MDEVRQDITKIIKRYMEFQGYRLHSASKSRHSLDSWVYAYTNAGGNNDIIKIEINYSLRSHIYEPVNRPIVTQITGESFKVRTLDAVELFAAKLNALMSRAAVRDLYDINNMITYGLFDETQYDDLRKSTVFYAAISAEVINKEFHTDAVDEITINKIKRDLFPVIAAKEHFDLDEKKRNAKTFILQLMCLTEQEQEFLERFEKKEYRPELLFSNEEILKRIENHPMAQWKMLHGNLT